MIPHETIRELETACQTAKDYAGAFNDAVKAQAEKHDLDPQGLGRFIRARVNDKLAKLQAEQDTVEQLVLFSPESPNTIVQGLRDGSVTVEDEDGMPTIRATVG